MAAEKAQALGARKMYISTPEWSLMSWATSIKLFNLSEQGSVLALCIKQVTEQILNKCLFLPSAFLLSFSLYQLWESGVHTLHLISLILSLWPSAAAA